MTLLDLRKPAGAHRRNTAAASPQLPLADALGKVLSDLADGCSSPRAVAGRLRRAGMRGAEASCAECPVGAWIVAKLSQAGFPGAGAFVWNGSAATWQAGNGQPVVTADLPDVLRDFTREFDAGGWPRLSRPSTLYAAQIGD